MDGLEKLKYMLDDSDSVSNLCTEICKLLLVFCNRKV